ncbi:MAG: UDP-N-acetylmuramate dehydrogenase [Alphaproteobacteria bacterium]|nr:UDP-N-acetylmuramate dehydrogenase [Alphaproteobacteria bacterium]
MTALISRLPSVRGKFQTNISMAEHTWFGVGGAAEVLFTPADAEDLHTFLKALDADIPVYPVGAGSNLLVRDGGVSGVIISTKAIKHHHIEGTHLTVGSGWLDAEVARLASRENIAGLEFLIGIPGTIGGGLRMNAGAFGKEFRDVVMTATAIDRQGNWHEVTPAEMGMAYRHSNAPLDWIFVSATLIGESGKSEDIRAAMKAIIATRSDAQPQGVRTGGSTFANPEGHKAWQLIDQAGCRGLAHGAAEVSEKHCNFLINRGNASADDIETLGETIRDRVKATSQVDLRWEIRRIGKTASGGKHEQD